MKSLWTVPMICMVIAGASGCATGMAPATRGGARLPMAKDRLFIAILVPARIDRMYQAELDRLTRLCLGKPLGCQSQQFLSHREQVGLLRERPTSDARVTGTIYASLRMRRGQYSDPSYGDFETLAVALEVEAPRHPGVYREWIPDVGDWGYGVYISGVLVRNGWVSFVNSSIVEGWLSPDQGALTVDVTPLKGEIVHLSPLLASWPAGVERAIEPGQYLITNVIGDRIEFRQEIESDFACGKEVEPPATMPPTLHTTADHLFNLDGSARFDVVYTKGC